MRNLSTIELISFADSCEEVVDPESAALLRLHLPGLNLSLSGNYMKAD